MSRPTGTTSRRSVAAWNYVAVHLTGRAWNCVRKRAAGPARSQIALGRRSSAAQPLGPTAKMAPLTMQKRLRWIVPCGCGSRCRVARGKLSQTKPTRCAACSCRMAWRRTLWRWTGHRSAAQMRAATKQPDQQAVAQGAVDVHIRPKPEEEDTHETILFPDIGPMSAKSFGVAARNRASLKILTALRISQPRRLQLMRRWLP